MSKDYISIQEAADLSNKSVQTIRRAIKAKKLNCKKKRTPQGFNYIIEKDSLYEVYGMKIPLEEAEKKEMEVSDTKSEQAKTETPITENRANEREEGVKISAEKFDQFTKLMEKMVSQHSEERQSFLRLMNTLQEKIFFLENQVNLLKAPERKWFEFWK